MKILYVFAFLLILLFESSSTFAQPSPTIEPFISGLTRPVRVVNAGDARLFVAEIGGKVKIVKNGSVLSQPFLDISDKINDPDWAGIFSIVFAPDYQSSGKFYLLYVLKNSTQVQLSEFKRSTSNADLADAASEVKILTIPYEDVLGGHRGGDLAFGKDGFLYVSTGDNGPGSRGDIGDPGNNAQNMTKLFGKILRLNVNSTNPAENILTKIFALGLRNPWRFSFDKSTGDLWIGDNGQDSWEEVNYLKFPFTTSTPNFGWNCLEGTQTYNASHCAQGTTYTPPKYTYPGFNNNGGSSASVMGGYVYRGSNYPSMNGYYFFGDYQTGKIGLLSPGGTGSYPAGLTYASTISFGEDQNGELYVLSFLNGNLAKITNPGESLPVKLSYFHLRHTDFRFILEWKSLSENNFKQFDLQRSTDAKRFESVAVIPAGGTDVTYQFEDNATGKGNVFYRLKLMDNDGSYQYSRMVSARNDPEGPVTVFPNPSTGFFEIKGIKNDSRISLRNWSGKLVLSKPISVTDRHIDMSDYPSGLYTLEILDHVTGLSQIRKLVKK